MAAGNTYVALASTTLSSTSSSVSFSSISGAYTDLVIICNTSITTGTTNLNLRYNLDVAANYSWLNLSGTGSAAASNYDPNKSQIRLHDYAFLSSTISNYIVSIQNYSNTTTYKTLLSRGNNASNGVSANVGLWRSTAAINAIELFPTASTFISGSTFTLYGIAAA